MILPRIVSLFSGAGGLDLGFKEAGYKIDFALDKAVLAIASHRANFPKTYSIAADLVELGPSRVVELIGEIIPAGESIAVIGGPPCQAFSRSNPFADVADPRNLLPMLYLDIVEMLQTRYSVQFVLFENVLGIRDVKHAETFAGILARLEELSLHASVGKYTALDFAVPQDRQRVIISAFASLSAREKFRPRKVERGDLALRQAFEGIPEPVFYSRSITPEDIPYHPNHWTMRPVSSRFKPNSPEQKTRSFRRLRWDKPSPTVAYGHREIHVHPEGHRRLSIYEAMILQGFPSNFQLMGPLSAQVEQVSNAVPPPMAKAMALGAAHALSQTATGEQSGIEE